MIASFLPALLVSAGVSALVTGLIVKYGRRLKIMDDPASHKHAKVVHSVAVPRGGGIPILASVVVGSWLFLPLSDQRVVGILGGVSILAIVGFLDDRFEEKISPLFRLFVNVLAALSVIAAGVGIAYITNPFGGTIDLSWPRYCIDGHCLWILSDIFALLWLVAMQNIVGWSSGVDGQLPGFVVIAAVAMGLLSLRFADASQLPVIILAAITAGAYLGFLPWNWYPQKIIPGYGGKSLAGFLLGVLAIFSVAKVGALILVLGIPIIDATLVIFKRIREGRSPMLGGREHLHHYLLDQLKWGRRRIAIFYWGMSAGLGILALNLNSRSKYFTMAAVALFFGILILCLQNWSTFSKLHGRDNGSKT